MNIPIHVNDDSFDIAVIKSPVPVIVYFWGPMCGPCKMMAPVLDEIARERMGGLRVAKVNVEDNPGLVRSLGIRSTPTALIYSGGELRETMVGLKGKRVLLDAIDALRAQQPVSEEA